MPKIERICPECGTSNRFDRTECIKCRAPLTFRPEPHKPPPAPLSRHGMAIFAWRATKFMTRLGLALALKGAQRGFERVRERNNVNVKNETIDGEVQVPESRGDDTPNPNLPARGWRVWSTPSDPGTAKKPDRLSWGKKE